MPQYRVTAVWWPDGWEPCSPTDVPNCIAASPEDGPAKPVISLDRALATVRGLNRQNMDHPGAHWYVVAEADSPAESSGGGLQSLRVVRPGEGRGDCSYCPAAGFSCAPDKS